MPRATAFSNPDASWLGGGAQVLSKGTWGTLSAVRLRGALGCKTGREERSGWPALRG